MNNKIEICDIIKKINVNEIEMLFVIKEYIQIKKNINIEINTCKNIVEITMMNNAYEIARNYFFNYCKKK